MGVFFDFAHKLYDNGYSIIPVQGKHPLIDHWTDYSFKRADEQTIDEWEKKFPNANISIMGGEVNGLVWLDVDSYTDSYCARMLELLPHLKIKRIGQKGFATPVRFKGQTKRGFQYRGIPMGDFLGNKRHIVTIGKHPITGNPYHWVGEQDIVDLSLADLKDLAIDLSDGELELIEATLEKEDFKLHKLDLEKKALKGAPGGAGGRNNRLKSICGAMFERGCDVQTVALEIYEMDLKMHESKPLFSDSADFHGMPPQTAALQFASSIFQTYLREKTRKHETIPQAELVPISNQMPVLSFNKRGEPHSSLSNVLKVLRVTPSLKEALFYDDFYERVLTIQKGIKREWRDDDDLRLQEFLQTKGSLPVVALSTVQSSVEHFAYAHRQNGLLDWLKALKWDQCKRIDDFLTNAMGASDSEYTKAVSSNFWKAMVARVINPGCKFDNMLVLEGLQGSFKSSALEIIGGEWYGVASAEIGTNDFLQGLSGKLLIEIAELDSFRRTEVATIKRVLSTRIDTYRPPYARRARDFKRQCVIVGTTNEDEYLEDTTGGRRFWPVHVTKVDLELIRHHREQLFAEAYQLVKAGASWWEVPKSLAEAEQETRRRHDTWEEIIQTWINAHDAVALTTGVIASRALAMNPIHMDRSSQLRIGKCMRSLGYKLERETIGSREYSWLLK